MALLAFIDTVDGRVKKSAFEILTYAKKTAEVTGDEVYGLIIGKAENKEGVTHYGANKIIHLNPDMKGFDTRWVAKQTKSIAEELGAHTILMSHSSSGKSLAGYLAVLMDASCLTGVNSIPEKQGDKLVLERNVFSGKAGATIEMEGPNFVITVMGNSLQAEQLESSSEIETREADTSEVKVKIQEISTVSGKIPLPEADLVVSAGRGMKGPENWSLVEELADVVGATTACSRPVADSDWRPHHEHVGQTGVAIRPNLYIAIGISGAIQHLAGVNQSKTIVVINKDPEAPFFKAADYGICADLFDVVPRLIESFKKFQSSN